MSMIGEYLRVTPSELDRAVNNPEWAQKLAEQVQDEQEDGGLGPEDAKHFSTYQTWHLLDFLLRRRGFPVDVVMGETEFGGEDWGYEPPRFLSVDRVRVAAEELGRLSYDDLIDGVDVAEVAAAQIYPQGWDTRESLEWGRDYFGSLALFLQATSAAGDAVIAWID
ncbi:hypothetical protein ABH920_008810 [Catenulispora sp. EB89]|uniref:YfbM family protein n=1 Tax=Catenulispora sp. EB89 TaxID=3156257 RepID=UPI003512B052